MTFVMPLSDLELRKLGAAQSGSSTHGSHNKYFGTTVN